MTVVRSGGGLVSAAFIGARLTAGIIYLVRLALGTDVLPRAQPGTEP